MYAYIKRVYVSIIFFYFQFLTTNKKRAKDSASVFYQTLFGENPGNDLPVVNPSDDRLYVSNEYYCFFFSKHSNLNYHYFYYYNIHVYI